MSEQQYPYIEINRLCQEKRRNEAEFEREKQRMAQKLVDCEREVNEEYLAVVQPLLTAIQDNSNQLLELENRTMGSITPFTDAIRDLRVHMDRRFNDLDRKVSGMSVQQLQLRNLIMTRDGEKAVPVPFLDGSWPEDKGLPEIISVEDIDRLSRPQCREYLTGYGISFAENETVNLKKKLRTVIGFGLMTDVAYSFSGFDTR